MNKSFGTDDIDHRLAEIVGVLERDGFDAVWAVDDSAGLRFTVRLAGADCAECLVPEPVLRVMLETALDGTGLVVADVELPSQ